MAKLKSQFAKRLAEGMSAKDLKAPVNLQEVAILIDGLVDWVRAGFEARDAVLKRIETKGVEYKGVWQASQDYRRGDLVTFDGSVWHANATTRAKPGSGSKAWTLAVKRGADAR